MADRASGDSPRGNRALDVYPRGAERRVDGFGPLRPVDAFDDARPGKAGAEEDPEQGRVVDVALAGNRDLLAPSAAPVILDAQHRDVLRAGAQVLFGRDALEEADVAGVVAQADARHVEPAHDVRE